MELTHEMKSLIQQAFDRGGIRPERSITGKRCEQLCRMGLLDPATAVLTRRTSRGDVTELSKTYHANKYGRAAIGK